MPGPGAPGRPGGWGGEEHTEAQRQVGAKTQAARRMMGKKTATTLKHTAGWAQGVRGDCPLYPHPFSRSLLRETEVAGVGETWAADPHLFQRPCRCFLGLRLLLAAGLQDGHDGIGDVCLLGEEQDGGAMGSSDPETPR